MLILLTFAESDGVSHAPSPQPGEREEELTGVKTEKKPLKKKHGRHHRRRPPPSPCIFPQPFLRRHLHDALTNAAFPQLFRSVCPYPGV